MEETGPGSLKFVSVWSPERPLADAIAATLAEHAPRHNVRRLHGEAVAVHTEASTATIRAWIAPLLRDGESLFVAEFERWSAHGKEIDSRWLLRRGH